MIELGTRVCRTQWIDSRKRDKDPVERASQQYGNFTLSYIQGHHSKSGGIKKPTIEYALDGVIKARYTGDIGDPGNTRTLFYLSEKGQEGAIQYFDDEGTITAMYKGFVKPRHDGIPFPIPDKTKEGALITLEDSMTRNLKTRELTPVKKWHVQKGLFGMDLGSDTLEVPIPVAKPGDINTPYRTVCYMPGVEPNTGGQIESITYAVQSNDAANSNDINTVTLSNIQLNPETKVVTATVEIDDWSKDRQYRIDKLMFQFDWKSTHVPKLVPNACQKAKLIQTNPDAEIEVTVMNCDKGIAIYNGIGDVLLVEGNLLTIDLSALFVPPKPADEFRSVLFQNSPMGESPTDPEGSDLLGFPKKEKLVGVKVSKAFNIIQAFDKLGIDYRIYLSDDYDELKIEDSNIVALDKLRHRLLNSFLKKGLVDTHSFHTAKEAFETLMNAFGLWPEENSTSVDRSYLLSRIKEISPQKKGKLMTLVKAYRVILDEIPILTPFDHAVVNSFELAATTTYLGRIVKKTKGQLFKFFGLDQNPAFFQVLAEDALDIASPNSGQGSAREKLQTYLDESYISKLVKSQHRSVMVEGVKQTVRDCFNILIKTLNGDVEEARLSVDREALYKKTLCERNFDYTAQKRILKAYQAFCGSLHQDDSAPHHKFYASLDSILDQQHYPNVTLRKALKKLDFITGVSGRRFGMFMRLADPHENEKKYNFLLEQIVEKRWIDSKTEPGLLKLVIQRLIQTECLDETGGNHLIALIDHLQSPISKSASNGEKHPQIWQVLKTFKVYNSNFVTLLYKMMSGKANGREKRLFDETLEACFLNRITKSKHPTQKAKQFVQMMTRVEEWGGGEQARSVCPPFKGITQKPFMKFPHFLSTEVLLTSQLFSDFGQLLQRFGLSKSMKALARQFKDTAETSSSRDQPLLKREEAEQKAVLADKVKNAFFSRKWLAIKDWWKGNLKFKLSTVEALPDRLERRVQKKLKYEIQALKRTKGTYYDQQEIINSLAALIALIDHYSVKPSPIKIQTAYNSLVKRIDIHVTSYGISKPSSSDIEFLRRSEKSATATYKKKKESTSVR